MITRVDTVLVANAACPPSYSTNEALNAGEVALFDENKNVIADGEAAIAANAVYIGVCKGTMKVVNPSTGALEDKKQIEFSNKIQKNKKVNCVLQTYVAPTQDTIKIDLTNAALVIGHRYVIRIIYKDIYEHVGQFTHTYEAIAKTTTASDLVNEFVKIINNHPGRRVTASATGTNNSITLTALEKDDNEGLYSINDYSTVSMEAVFYYTIPGALLSNVPTTVTGATITKTQGTPGKGYWKQVRDREKYNAGYKGHIFIDAYPMIIQKHVVKEGETYDYLTIENDNDYLSPDNQYVKSTPLTTELYVKSGSLSASRFYKNLKSFISGEEVA